MHDLEVDLQYVETEFFSQMSAQYSLKSSDIIKSVCAEQLHRIGVKLCSQIFHAVSNKNQNEAILM